LKNILILGANGMLGNTLMNFFSSKINEFNVFGTIRKNSDKQIKGEFDLLFFDAKHPNSLIDVFSTSNPDIVFNCIGRIKQHEYSSAVDSISLNSLFPHQLRTFCDTNNSWLIHFSTDCVFSGNRGMYTESDVPDSVDLYGRSKLLGEVRGRNMLTIRTSIIGHELDTNRSLIDWFLNQKDSVEGYKNAIFSGIPTIELARIIYEFIFPRNLEGLYHVSSEPINKYDLLCLVREVYNKDIEIRINRDFKIDRSLDSTAFRSLTGFEPDSWRSMITKMKDFQNKSYGII
jgi:dTDP-4-dehydrorhamnose reductase